MLNGKIELDSEAGKEIGFISARFNGYLWKREGSIIISFIESKAKGNFKELVDAISAKGLRVDVPTPLGRMADIVTKNNYKHHIEYDENEGAVDVWSLSP